jgi:DNA polymerase-1
MFDVGVNDVSREMRTAAKRVNFGIIYGISAFGLAKDLGVSQAQAQDFIDRYFLRYPNVKTFMDRAIESCEKLGYAETLLKRRRMIPEIHNQNIAVRQFAQRQAINTPVQGSAADLMKIAMIRIDEGLRCQGFSSKMLITVHDELVFDMVPDEEKDLVILVRNEMEQALELSVPIKVSVRKGNNWLDLEDME